MLALDGWFRDRPPLVRACMTSYQRLVSSLRAVIGTADSYLKAIGDAPGNDDCPAQRVAIVDFRHQVTAAMEAASHKLTSLEEHFNALSAEWSRRKQVLQDAARQELQARRDVLETSAHEAARKSMQVQYEVVIQELRSKMHACWWNAMRPRLP